MAALMVAAVAVRPLGLVANMEAMAEIPLISKVRTERRLLIQC